MRIVLVVLALACVLVADAATTIYRCERDGKITYSGTPCEATAKEAILPECGPSAPIQAHAPVPSEFIAAVRSGDVHRTATLIAKGADVRVRDSDGVTPLHWAVVAGHVPVIELLVASGAPINARSSEGVSPLHLAATLDRAMAAELLLAHGAEIDIRTQSGYTPLINAAREGHLHPAEVLIRHGADVNARDARGTPAIVWALYAATLASPSGRNVVAITNPGLSPAQQRELLERAKEAKGQWREIAKLLLDHKAQTNLGPGAEQPLYWAAWLGDGPLIQQLLDHGANINHTEGGETALHAAIAESHRNAAAILIGNGANVNAENMSRRTPLHFLAAAMNDGALAELLIRHGANVNARDKNGATPLVFAAKAGNGQVADVLQRNGGR